MTIPFFLHHFNCTKLEQFWRNLFLLRFQSRRFSLGLRDLLLRLNLDACQIVLRLFSVLFSDDLGFDGLLELIREREIGYGNRFSNDVIGREANLDEVFNLVAHLLPLADEFLDVVLSRNGFDGFKNRGINDTGFSVIIQINEHAGRIPWINMVRKRDFNMDDLDVVGRCVLRRLDDAGLDSDRSHRINKGSDEVCAGIQLADWIAETLNNSNAPSINCGE